MAVKVAINGYGRIGRNILRALYESGRTGDIEIVPSTTSAMRPSCAISPVTTLRMVLSPAPWRWTATAWW